MIKRKGLPDVNELTMCTVKRITPYAAWCDLDEYEAEGMIHVSQAAGKWVHDIREFVKKGKQYVAKVVKVDAEKSIVNLSLKQVSKRDTKEKMNEYRKAQHAEKILEQAGKQMDMSLKQAYDEVGYLLQEKFGELSTAFDEGKEDQNNLKEAGVPKAWVDVLMPIIQKAIKDKEFVIRADVKLMSYEGDGLERLKAVLSEMKRSGFQVTYISAPNYMLEVTTKDPKVAEKKMRDTLDKLAEKSRQEKVELEYQIDKK